ncbi:MAG: 6-hydroxycyclohex-1-ene-1-carbonyl-CoA dehydrogenase [Thermoanaerobaculia bacterium]
MSTNEQGYGYELTEPGRPLERRGFDQLEPGADEVVVEVAGCGVCHTDVSFAYDGVPTRHPLPLILGHEIAGRVVDAGEHAANWMGSTVLVPAVIPCGACRACAAGRPTVCSRQFMPGNDGDGGFATHVKVPPRGLCPVPEPLPSGLRLESLAVIADAVTTPFEAIRRAALSDEDVAVFVGAGGVGGFGVQIAAAMGAAVAAIDIDTARLDLVRAHGAGLALDAGAVEFRELKAAIHDFAKQSGRGGIGLKIFETSGTPAGQRTAFGLMGPGAHLAVVGFTPAKIELRLSNLMAFDATARGNWGSSPEVYPEALSFVLDGRVLIEPFVERHPLTRAAEVLEAVHHHRLQRRPILTPEAT